MKPIEDLQNDKRDDLVVVLTLSELASILKIASKFEKSSFERKQEIMDIYKKRYCRNVQKVHFILED